jgi:tetratricopeptide (TPR) repeat protein
MILLLAGLTTGALEPRELSAPLDQEEYLEADDWFQAGLLLNSEGRFQEATEAFAKSVSIEPGNAFSWLNLGTAQALLGDYPHAIDALKKSVLLDPGIALAYSNLAEVCFRTDRFQDAVEAYTALIALWPDNANAHYKRGLCYLALHQGANAQADYLSLKIVDPELAEKLLQAINRAPDH